MPQRRIPNKLKLYRKLAGLTQQDVAKILGLKCANRISSWEKSLSVPSLKNLLKLSILYCTLPAELYSDEYKEFHRDIQSAKEKIVKKSASKNI